MLGCTGTLHWRFPRDEAHDLFWAHEDCAHQNVAAKANAGGGVD